MNLVFVLVSIFVFLVSCSQKEVVAKTSESVSTKVNLVSGQSREPQQEEAAGETESIASGRRLNIPQNQAELALTCEQQLENVPAAYKSVANDFIIHHRAYKVSYNSKHRIPNWVYYNLSRENLVNSCAKRKDKFKGDPALVAAQFPTELVIGESGYKNSGFDRGHMAPSGDFLWNQNINEETFFMTNMSPQTAELNQKTWNSLEERVRNWACGFGEVKVYTGPIIEPNMKRLNSCVSIPNKFFKVLLAQKNKKLVGIGFVYSQNDKAGDPFRERAVPIRKVEELSGIDFFKDDFSQVAQDGFETNFDIKEWEGSEENCFACDGVLKKKN